MRYVCLTSIYLAAVCAQADTGSSSSVFEQMRLNGVSQQGVLIESLEVNDSNVLVSYKIGDQIKQTELCRDVRNEPFFGVTYHNQRVEMLRSALQSGEKVDLGINGPWSPCLQSVKISKAK